MDKKLGGVQAVQTLSRLNRTYPGKDKTFVLDFVNEPEAILEAFLPYYRQASLTATTDPNLVYDLKSKLDSAGLYDWSEVEQAFHFIRPDHSIITFLKECHGPTKSVDKNPCGFATLGGLEGGVEFAKELMGSFRPHGMDHEIKPRGADQIQAG